MEAVLSSLHLPPLEYFAGSVYRTCCQWLSCGDCKESRTEDGHRE